MGQYFTFLNIDKRQQLKPTNGLKMGEFFFSGYFPTAIMKLLAIPPKNDPTESKAKDNAIESWAQDRIICIGDYVNDWPDSILNSDDGHTLESPKFLYDNARKISYYDLPRKCPTYPGHGAVLRNLTKKIYVRANGIPVLCRDDEKLRIFDNPPARIDCIPGLGSVLLGRVGWSADPSASMSWAEADTLTAGEWAGDRFDVRSYDEVKNELESGGWVDGTEEEALRITDLWDADGYV